jgi:hypothetical protein
MFGRRKEEKRRVNPGGGLSQVSKMIGNCVLKPRRLM